MCTISTTLNEFFDSYSPSLSTSLRENRLNRMRLLLERLGNPERNIKMIHIAGSKGKGTTASFLSWIMNAYNLKTGLYLSPHVYDIRERFTLGTRFFSDDLYKETLQELKNKLMGFSLPLVYGPEKPTTFELYTAYAYVLFKNAGCRYGVIETGLGGRLDATNTISPIANCFTFIEKEHTKILGSTLREIAGEKAGIMRKGVPSFIMDMPQEALDTLKLEGDKIGSPYEVFPPIEEYSPSLEKVAHIILGDKTIDVESPHGFTDVELYDLKFSLYVLDRLKIVDFQDKDHLDLMKGFNLPGRFQMTKRKIGEKSIGFIFDGAHTISSIHHLKNNMDRLLPRPYSTLIFSTAQDKNYREMADALVDDFGTVIVTGLGESKKSEPEAIYDYIRNKWKDKNILLSNTPDETLEKAIECTKDQGNIVVTGSFYLVDLIYKALGNIE